MLFLTATLLFLGQSFAQDTNCDYSQTVEPSRTYYILSPNYDASYPRGVQCRWMAQCPPNYNCRVDCYLNLPSTSECREDRVLISRSGDTQLINAERYCGQQTVTNIISIKQNISVGLITSANSEGGKFYCNLTAQAIPTPQPTCRCGVRKQSRIVGGSNAGVNEYTMMAALIDKLVDLILCGGVIITPNYIMSATHCLYKRSPSGVQVRVGNRNLKQGIRYEVSRLTIHSQYNSDTLDNDIGLLLLARSITFNDNLSPACLPFNLQNRNIDALAGSYVTLLGWGTKFFGGPTSEILQKVDVQVITQQQCSRTETITSRQICTNTTARDACQNDSGGPNLYTDPRSAQLLVVGIISQGVNCAERPGVSTRITPYIDWIVSNAPWTYCVVP